MPERAGIACFTALERTVTGAGRVTELEREAAGGGLTCFTLLAPEAVGATCFALLASEELGWGATVFPLIERSTAGVGVNACLFGPNCTIVLLCELLCVEVSSCGAPVATWPIADASIKAPTQAQRTPPRCRNPRVARPGRERSSRT
jgi:hypothetical protein